MAALMPARADQELARPLGDPHHGLDAVHHEIDDDLLQLHPVTEYRGQVSVKVEAQPYTMAQHFSLHQGDDVVNDIVDVERGLLWIGLLGERAQAPDHLARPIAVPDDAG